MKKIPTLFLRIYENHKVTGITNILTSSELQVVLDGKCVPTIKIDGACCAVINGEWYKRYDAKKGKKAPEGAIPCQDEPDEITGHWPHWVKIDETKADDKWFIEAFKNYKELYELPDGTYEAIGPHFQGNPYNLKEDTLYKHGSAIAEHCPHDFEGLKRYLEGMTIEGVVFWYNNEPLCKIKRSDFGFEWPIENYSLKTLDEIAQFAEQISREHLMTIQELEQKGLIKDDVISRPYIVTKEMYERLLKKDGKIKGE